MSIRPSSTFTFNLNDYGITETVQDIMKKDNRVNSTVITHLLTSLPFFKDIFTFKNGNLVSKRTESRALVRTFTHQGVDFALSKDKGAGRWFDLASFMKFYEQTATDVVVVDADKFPFISLTVLTNEDILVLEGRSGKIWHKDLIFGGFSYNI